MQVRCREILRHAATHRQLARDLDRLRHTLLNNGDVTSADYHAGNTFSMTQ